jgi:hypothetical protein
MNIVEQLRDTARKGVSVWGDLQLEAADEIEHLTEMLEQLIVGAVACVEVVVENERLFSENKLLKHKLGTEKKKTNELTADFESRTRCMKYWQELYSKCSKDLYELEQTK